MFAELLVRELRGVCELNAAQIGKLEGHRELLERWNKKVNLTRITRLEDVVRLHYCESIALGLALPEGRLRVVDVGSGAGFPGIPAAVVRPECEFDLVESRQRKAAFLREATRELKNVRVLTKRAEDLAAGYDWLVARAVSPEDIVKLRLAPRFALLVGGGGNFSACETRLLPWGKQRHLVLGYVSRGT